LIINADYQFSGCRGFLVLDGVNGAGKSTLLKQISNFLIEQQSEVVETLQPGGTPIGKKIRSMVLGDDPCTLLTELFLFAADRAEHVTQVIAPALQQGNIVLCDRYYYSTIAFQGYGRGMPLEQVTAVNRLAVQDMLPDLVVLLDLDPAEGLRRTKSRLDAGADSFEQEELSFHQRIRDGFLRVAEQCSEPVALIDASVTQDRVWDSVCPIIKAWHAAINRE